MASSRDYLNFILEQLSDLGGISHRAMMGEYILYYKGKIIGGIYDDRFLIKPVNCEGLDLSHAVLEAPYPDAKPMVLVENVYEKTEMTRLIEGIYPHLPEPKAKKSKIGAKTK